MLELTATQSEVISELLGALSVFNAAAAHPVLGVEPAGTLHVHELSLFLFAQLFSKESQRPDNQEIWVDAAASVSTTPIFDGAMLSPTRSSMSIRTSLSLPGLCLHKIEHVFACKITMQANSDK